MYKIQAECRDNCYFIRSINCGTDSQMTGSCKPQLERKNTDFILVERLHGAVSIFYHFKDVMT